MPRTVKPLSVAAINSAKANDGKIRKLFDGNGLQLWVMPDGAKYWRADFRIDGKRKDFAIGAYPKISLAEARKASQAARALAAVGTNPIAHRKAQKAQGKASAEHTFEAVAQRVIGKAQSRGRTNATVTKKKWILGKFTPGFRATPVSRIVLPSMKREVEMQVGVGSGEIAVRMQSLIIEVFRRASQDGLITYNPAHDLKGIAERKPSKHHPAIIEAEPLGALLLKVENYAQRNVVTGVALQLMALLYQRPGELRQANWTEFNLKTAVWQIPKERMKMRRPHTVYLPHQAVTLLEKLHDLTGPNGYVFPAIGRGARPLSENTMNHALRRMGVESDEHTPHGFRASASTLLNASGMFSEDMVELSLSHRDPDKVRAAYNRGEFIKERIRMAQWWADYLDRLKGEDGAAGERKMVSIRP